jgi:hypothetical protein
MLGNSGSREAVVGLPEERQHSPAECALVFAVPTWREEFERAARGPGDFVPRMVKGNPGRSLQSLWIEYAQVAEYARMLSAEARAMGALTTSNASLACWRSALRQRPVNVLFAHCRPGEPGAVEFADGLYGVEEVATAVPREFEGVIDFAVCHSLQLSRLVKLRAPRSQVIGNLQATGLDTRLALLRQTLRLVAAGGNSYPGAMGLAALGRSSP